MSPIPRDELEVTAVIDPQTPAERLLYLGVIMGVAAIITIGVGATWAVMTLKGDGADFTASGLDNVFYAALAFLFGGGIAAKL